VAALLCWLALVLVPNSLSTPGPRRLVLSDLFPLNRTTVKFMESVTLVNDGHEK
jgi:hypothetical protein